MKGVNLSVMNAVWSDIFDHGLPFIIESDFNVSPSESSTGSPLSKIGGVIRAPADATYVGSEGSYIIDFCVVSGILDHITGAGLTDLSGPYSPHRPVTLSVKQKCQDIKVQVPCSYQHIPAERGIGPVPPPPNYQDL
eukprot:8878487-Pyramimonas_sp.AAC.1